MNWFRQRERPEKERHCSVCKRTWSEYEVTFMGGHGYLNPQGVEIVCPGYPRTYRDLYREAEAQLVRAKAVIGGETAGWSYVERNE